MKTPEMIQGRLIAEDIAADTCRQVAAKTGWRMTWKWYGDRILIFCDGVPLNSIELSQRPNAGAQTPSGAR